MTPPLDAELHEHLHRHGAALRALAIVLLRDPHDAADAVQETWHRALRSPPRHAERLDAWLATLLRNVVRRLRRARSRRERHEAAAALTAAAAADPARELVHAETARRLLAAVEGLDPPYRGAVWQRFFAGQPPRAIAAASGVPVATVKSWLHRGLETLRARLGEGAAADGDGTASWRGALVAAFGLRRAELPTAGLIGGGVLMATWTKSIVAAAAAVLVLAWWWPRSEAAPGSGAVPHEGSVAAVAAAPSDEARTGRIEPPVEPAAVARVASAPALAPVHGAVAQRPAAAGVAVLRGRVVDDATGQPLAGVTVSLGNGMGIAPLPTDPRVVTTGDGSFTFAIAAGASTRLWFDLDGFVRAQCSGPPVAAGQTDEVGDIALRRGRRVTGRLLDANGAPVPAGTLVQVQHSTRSVGRRFENGLLQVRTDAQGVFVLEPAVAHGPAVLELPGGELELADDAPVAIGEREPAELVLVARPRACIRGVVVGGDGELLGGVGIARAAHGPVVRTAADGTFVLRRGDRSSVCSLHVVDAPDFVPPPPRDVAWNTRDVRIVLARAPSLELTVVDDRGIAVEEFGVVVQRQGLRGQLAGTVRQRARHADGRCTVAGVVPGATTVRIVPVDAALTPSAMVPVGSEGSLRVELVPRRAVAVEVLCGERPLPGLLVETTFADAAAPPDGHLRALTDPHAGARAWVPGSGPERIAAATTDTAGVARLLADVAVEGRGLRITGAGRAPFVLLEPLFPAGDAELRIDLPGSGAIAGRVALRDGPRDSVSVWLRRGAESWTHIAPEPDGTFRSPPLAAGSWRVMLRAKGLLLGSERDIDVVDGTATHCDYDLRDFPPAAVRGRLVRSGPLPPGLHVELLRTGVAANGESMASAPVAADGTFAADGLPAGSYRVAVRAPNDASLGSASFVPGVCAETLVLAAGERRDVVQPFPPRRLVVRLQRADGTAVVQQPLLARCGGITWPLFALSAPRVNDMLVLDPAPALPIEFRRGDSETWSSAVVMPPDRSSAEVVVMLP